MEKRWKHGTVQNERKKIKETKQIIGKKNKSTKNRSGIGERWQIQFLEKPIKAKNTELSSRGKVKIIKIRTGESKGDWKKGEKKQMDKM